MPVESRERLNLYTLYRRNRDVVTSVVTRTYPGYTHRDYDACVDITRRFIRDTFLEVASESTRLEICGRLLMDTGIASTTFLGIALLYPSHSRREAVDRMRSQSYPENDPYGFESFRCTNKAQAKINAFIRESMAKETPQITDVPSKSWGAIYRVPKRITGRILRFASSIVVVKG